MPSYFSLGKISTYFMKMLGYYFMDMKIIFAINTLVLLIISIISTVEYKKNTKNDSIKFLQLFIVLHFVGFVFFILRNQIPDFISIIIANTLFAIGTLSLYLATKSIMNIQPIWHNRYVVPIIIFFIGFIIFTYAEYDTRTRILIYYIMCFMYTISIAWLFWHTNSIKFKIFDKISAVLFTAVFLIFLGIILQTTFIKLQTYYFSNANTFMILSILIMDLLAFWTLFTIKYRVKN
jgi:hypothetical protein